MFGPLVALAATFSYAAFTARQDVMSQQKKQNSMYATMQTQAQQPLKQAPGAVNRQVLQSLHSV